MYSRQPFDSVVPNGLVVVASARAVKGVTATTASRYFRQARLQAAVTRALLDELERALPPSMVAAPFDAGCRQQLSEELAALARHICECVVAMSDAAG